ncbi:MAG: hypothetical protein PUG48_00420 [Clostridia bacterium]|nr:hypothetical protein [Clostridia bacterium]
MDEKKMNKVQENPDENAENKEVQNNRQPIDDTELEKVSGGRAGIPPLPVDPRPEDAGVF